MKYVNKHIKRCYDKELGINTPNNSTNRKTLKINSKWQVIYDRRQKRYKLIKKQVGLNEYVIYSLLNTDVIMETGTIASTIARSIIALYNKLAADRTKNTYINQWQKSGEHIVVLKGYHHKHLKYLEGEAKFVAIGIHATYQRCNNRVMLVLSVFGRKQEIEDIFDGLSYLR